MTHHRPFLVTGFHGCDKEVGLKVINGKIQLKASTNAWDWLGEGIYFWEQNPARALEYAIDIATQKQFNRVPIKAPFVVGAIIELGNCLNLMEPESLELLQDAYFGLEKIYGETGTPMPENKKDNRRLDARVFKHLHISRKNNLDTPLDTIRCAFSEGDPIYPGANFTSRLHIEVCVLNHRLIQGYYLPFPIIQYNPFLDA